ncbi:MAG: hypothetical protein IPN89_04085 [Saprospiraceae bacterium]|nr:hypothetical protein [Saprospiraceae bacterium]
MVIQNISAYIATFGSYQIPQNEIKEFICRTPGGYSSLSASASPAWSLTGNSGTNIATDFIGTTDNKPLNFRVSNNKAGLIDLSGNTSFGYVSMYDQLPGAVDNTVIGYKSLQRNRKGSGAIVIGARSANSDTIANGLIAIGRDALSKNVRAEGNFAIGDSSLLNTGFVNNNNVDGTNNFGIGKNTLKTNVIGQVNMAIGNYVLEKAINPIGNHGVGNRVLSNLIKGNDNIAYSSFRNLINGSENVGVGSVGNISKGSRNVLIGQANAFFFGLNDSIAENVIIGYRNINSYLGNRNVLIGANSGGVNVYGSKNAALGDSTLINNSTGSNNVAIGAHAGASNTTGNGNVFIGNRAGSVGASSNKLYIENSNADKNNSLIYGDFAADSLLLNGKTVVRNNAVVQGFSKLGGYASDVPSIKMKKIVNTGPALNDNKTIAHGLNAAKILEIEILMEWQLEGFPASPTRVVPPNFTSLSGLNYQYELLDGDIIIYNINGTEIAGRNLRILITYEE